jgi:hypothetical protein
MSSTDTIKKSRDLLLKDISFESNFSPDESFYKSFFQDALKVVLDDSWRATTMLKKRFINQEMFPFIWNNNINDRSKLVADLCCSGNTLPPNFKSGLAILISSELERVFESGSEEEHGLSYRSQCVSYRINLAPLICVNFDYLYEINQLDKSKDESLISLWASAGKKLSKDKDFYEYLWKSIERRPGASDEKLRVLERMNSNNVYSSLILKEVSKGGTKRVKRAVVEDITHKMNDLKRSINNSKRQIKKNPGEEEHEQLLLLNEEKLAKLEPELMLFADCDDRQIIGSMIDAVSRENLTWLIPAASKHYYLSRRIESMLASKDN